jgi:hypothetical protein
MKAIKRNLPDPPLPGVHLYCDQCGQRCSAHPGDYWHADPEFAFICCDEIMQIGRIRHTFEPLKVESHAS